MKKTNYLLIPALLLLITSCAPVVESSSEESSSSSEETSSSVAPVEVKDAKSAIERLAQIDNYKVTTYINNELYYNSIFTTNYLYSDTQNFGYLYKENGLYPFTYQNGNIVNKIESNNNILYGEDGVATTFKNIDTSLIEEDVLEFKTLKKKLCIPFLEIAGFTSDYYTLTQEIHFKLGDISDINSVEWDTTFREFVPGLGLTDFVFTTYISKVNENKNADIENFILNGKFNVIDPILSLVKNLFKEDNYTYKIYDAEVDELLQAELFTKDYFCRLFTDYAVEQSPILLLQQVCELEILEPNKQLDLLMGSDKKPIPLIYDDIYKFLYSGTYDKEDLLILVTRENPRRLGYAQGAYTEVCKDIAKVWRYPSSLLLFDNLDEFVKKPNEVNTYGTTSERLIRDFLANFNLLDVFKPYGGIGELTITYDSLLNDVIFTVYTNDGYGYYDLNFTDFGTTHFAPFDKLLEAIKGM